MLNSTFEKVASKEKLPILKVKLSPVSQIKLPKEVIQQALSIEEDKPSKVIRTPEGFYIVLVTRRIPSRIPAFEEVAPEVVQRLKIQKAPEAAENWAKDIVKLKDPLEKIVKEKQLKYQVKLSDYFTRRDGLKIGEKVFRKVAMKALQMKVHEKGYELENGKLVVFEVVDFKEPDPKEVEKQAEKLKPYLLSTKREEVWSTFLKEVKERTPIKINQKVWEAFR